MPAQFDKKTGRYYPYITRGREKIYIKTGRGYATREEADDVSRGCRRATGIESVIDVLGDVCTKANPDSLTIMSRESAMQHIEDLRLGRPGVCPICGKVEALVQDHDHTNGLLRLPICRDCNAVLCDNLESRLDKLYRYYLYFKIKHRTDPDAFMTWCEYKKLFRGNKTYKRSGTKWAREVMSAEE